MAPSAIFLSRPEAWNEVEGCEVERNILLNLDQTLLDNKSVFTPGPRLIPSDVNAWPKKLVSSLVWDGSRYARSKEYIYQLSEVDKAELECALSHFKSLGLRGEQIEESTFPLPQLGHALRSLSAQLREGRGFFSIRGLVPSDYSIEDNALLYLGISSYIANLRGIQDDEGYMFAHIREASESSTQQMDRPFRDSNLGLTFHTDNCSDILALQTLSLAARGGEHMIASSWNIYNELSAYRPDLLEVLSKPSWYLDEPDRPGYGLRRPLIFYNGGQVLLNFVRHAITGDTDEPRASKLPDATPEQLEALDAIEEIASRNALILDMQPGDLTYVNNWAICHSRLPFQNDEKHTRHLVRMWLKNESLAWNIPRELKARNDYTFYNQDILPCWNISPQPRITFKAWDKLSP